MNTLTGIETTEKLSSLVKETEQSFKAFTEMYWSEKPLPHKWSRKEILGHLIDSANNNLRRFCESQFLAQEPYVILEYQQENLVKTNNYQALPVDHLIRLWVLINTQIIYVLAIMPKEKRAKKVLIPEGSIETVEWLAEDYVVHMQHHLDQIFNTNWPYGQ